jgi:serine kinase of HPr protein (carbohydrate metabolism regulator)
MSEAHQASCVAIGGRGVLIEGPPCSGKSSLALALIDRGAELVGDDGVLLEPRADRLLARPHPNTKGLIEVRNLGIVPHPCTPQVAVALIILLDPAAPRFIEAAEAAERGGVSVPLIRLWPESPVLAIRAELALARYGLSLD